MSPRPLRMRIHFRDSNPSIFIGVADYNFGIVPHLQDFIGQITRMAKFSQITSKFNAYFNLRFSWGRGGDPVKPV